MRISMWYWLNTAPEGYADDFRMMKEIGCDRAYICFGLDLSLIAQQAEMTLRALDCCQHAGLEAALIIYNPSAMGETAERFRPTRLDGCRPNCGNIYDPAWLAEWWQPYLRAVAGHYGDHPALAGYLLDDTFGCGDGTIHSYTAGDGERFQAYLKDRYRELPRLNDLWRCAPEVASWDDIDIPRDPVAQTGAWSDWTDARRQWVNEWAAVTVSTLHENGRQHPVIYTDYDFYWRRSYITHGAHLPDIAAIFDEYGLYEAMPTGTMSREAIVHNWRGMLAQARSWVPDRPLHTLMWLTDVRTFEPMDRRTLRDMLLAAKETGAAECQLYAFRVSDWTRKESFEMPYLNLGETHRLSESLYPDRLETLAAAIRDVK